MAANGILDFQGTNQVNFMGAASNIVIDTVTASLGIGVDVNGPTSNLHVVGNAHVSTNLTIGGNIDFIGNLTQNGAAYGGGGAADPSPWLPTTVNVPADGIYYTAGNVAVDTNTFFVDTVNDRVGVGTTTPGSTLDVNGSLRAAYDQDVTSYFGRVAIGYSGVSQGATFAHLDHNTGTDYAFKQTWFGQAILNTKSNQSISFRVGDIEKAKIISGGDFLVDTNTLYVDASTNRVGVGTTTPGYKLDVAGDINFTGALTQNGTTYGGGGGSGSSQWVTSGNNIHYPTGDVGIGTTTPGYELHVVGDIYSTGNITAYSDKRAKENIEKIENALDKVCTLGGYTYTMKGQKYTGLIAQEVLEVLPEAVTGSEETNYALAYGNMMGLIVEAIKELKQKIG